MPDEIKKQRLKGLSNFGYFTGVKDTATAYTVTGTRVALEGANTLNQAETVNKVDIPADDNPKWDTETDWQGTELTYAVRAMRLADLAALKGATMSTGADISMIESINDVAPCVAVNFAALRADGGYRCFLYYVCELTNAQTNFQTRSGSPSPQDYTLTFTCSGRKKAGDGVLRETADFDTLDNALTWLNTPPAAV